jgi:hypothetical protein
MGVSGWYPGWYGKGHILISIYSMPYNANSVCNKSNYMGATSGAGTAYPSWLLAAQNISPQLILLLQVKHLFSIFNLDF